ncbi:MAG: enoyl-CoA hydratase/isomerase family protein [Burkholderiales bacterium]|nr:enoyl-CoA hydratase/isomerase family protein [Burkholderiales bacterium]
MAPTTLEIECRSGIGTVWLNRPEVRNAFDEGMIAELAAAFAAMAADDAVRVVVVGGRGSAFCAGADLNWMKKMAGFSPEENYVDALGLAEMLHALAALPKPTVARVHGAAFAGGLGLVAACDIAVAAHEAEFCVSEVKLGLLPATIGPHLVAAMGARAARRYWLTAERFGAAEAHRIGLVHEIAPAATLDTVVQRISAELLGGGPAAQAATKELIRAVAGKPLARELREDTAQRIAATRASDEGKEGVRAFLEKRKPAWRPDAAPSGRARD